METKDDKTDRVSKIKIYTMVGIVLVLLISIVESFQINAIKNKITANVVKNAGIDMSGWTEDEKMEYEHHGTLPLRLQQNQERQPTMVGGC